MASNPLMDSLTSHISLYHSSISLSKPNPSPRSSILKWFSSLTVYQRQASLTIVDHGFTQILLQMLGKIRTQGHGFFFILPDLPSRYHPGLPGLCFRKSRGLLSRIAESNESERLIRESIRMFESKEGENVVECSCSVNCLDTVTLSQVFVENVDRFVAALDCVSNGGFLRGEENVVLGSHDWVELGWLKDKGYYSIEAFVANKLELALRLAWLNCNNRKKRGVKLKEKTNSSGVAANVYGRKKGCVDWWGNLDAAMRQKVLYMVWAKSAKSLTNDILNGVNSSMEDEMWLFNAGAKESLRYQSIKKNLSKTKLTSVDAEFGFFMIQTTISSNSTPFANKYNRLYVLLDIVNTILLFRTKDYDKENLFYSTLDSVGTIADCISRKLRGLLMVVSLDCIKLELLEEGDSLSLPNKGKEKQCASTRRKKGKTRNNKRLNSALRNHGGDCDHDEPLKSTSQDLRCVPSKEKADHVKLDMISGVISEKNNREDISQAIQMGITQDDGRLQNAARKKRRERNKVKRSCSDNKSTARNLEAPTLESCSHASVLQGELVEPIIKSDDSNVQHGTNTTTTNVPYLSKPSSHTADINENCIESVPRDTNKEHGTGLLKEQGCGISFDTERKNTSYEWPSVAPFHYSMVNPHIPPATDRLHLDVGLNWHNHFHQSFVPTMRQIRSPLIDGGGCSQMLTRPVPMSLDWPPMVRGASGLVPSLACNYDYKYISRRQSSFEPLDLKNKRELTDDGDDHWISEEEYEVHAVSGMDYNQYFGGGVMYWDPSDYLGAGFSRPPSLSSEDSSYYWHEAEMKRSVDDMVAFSSSYSTNGLTSPSAASFCSSFDPMGGAHHPGSKMLDVAVDDKVSGSLATVPSDIEGKSGDSFPYPILPRIIIPNISRERSRSEFKRSHDHKSPCVPHSRRDYPRIKRPPSPVVLCVPQVAPRPPPPSPISDPRKQKGFPTVRSGSSSPRNWGVKGWYHDGADFEESCLCMDGTEIFLPSWSNNNPSARPMIQPRPGALLPDRLIAISQISRDQEHPDVSFPIQPPDLLNCPLRKTSVPLMQRFLHDEIDSFCKQVAVENTIRKPYINWAVKRITRSLQVLWPRSRTNVFGSITTGLSLPSSDVDIVVSLPPVRNLEPIKEAGILEGRNGIKETFLQHAARYLANQEWVKNDSLKTVENTAIPIIMLVVEVPCDLIRSTISDVSIQKDVHTWNDIEQGKQAVLDNVVSENSASSRASNLQDEHGKNSKSVRIDISFKSPSHTGVQTTKLVKELTEQFPAATPLALVLKQFLADRSLDQSYCGGLSSYCLVLLITRFLQQEHHLGRPINQKFGSLLMDFLYFFGNVFDPRQMRVSVQGSGVYIKRERGYSIDPIHIDDPLFPTNNVGRNCFRIHQCIKAFSDAYTILESELTSVPIDGDLNTNATCRILPKIIPSIDLYRRFNDGKDT